MQLPVVKVHLYHTTGGWFLFVLIFVVVASFLYGLFHVPLFGNWKEENPRGF